VIARAAVAEDFARLKEIHAESELDFPLPDFDSEMIEGIEVIEDERGEIILAAIAKRVPEIYLLAPKGQLHPTVKMEGIRLLHSALRDDIASKGYNEYFSFIAPTCERAFGRHLKKWFGWEKAWPAYRLLDWKEEPNAEGR
jgi:hypothetical protein